MTVSLDGNVVLADVQVPNVAPDSYWFGFGAGAGSLFDRHEVRNISIRFSNRACF